MSDRHVVGFATPLTLSTERKVRVIGARPACHSRELELDDALRTAVRMLRETASKVGPMHSYWDYIVEFERLIGEPMP